MIIKKNIKHKIIVFCYEYFPPKQFNAYHNRLITLTKGFKKENEVIIICPNKNLKFDREIYEDIQIYRIPNLHIPLVKNIINPFLYPYFLNKQIKKINYNPDILWYDSVYSFYLAKKTHYYKIYDVMGILSKEILADNSIYHKFKSLVYHLMEKSVYKNSDLITTINEAHKNIIKKEFKKEIIVVRDGINLTKNKNRLTRQDKNINLFFVGSFGKDRLKNILNAFKIICKKIPNIKIIIVGDGKYLDHYKQIILNEKIQEKFVFKGYLRGKELEEQMQLADICFSDDWSYIGFPTKVFEYMSMGKAILVEDTPAVREIISDNINGLVYKNSIDFIDKVIKLSKNNQLRTRLGKQAKKDILYHTWNNREEQYNNILNKIRTSNKK
jgi:glycosyltransferase involved in cell wall biosynthesis